MILNVFWICWMLKPIRYNSIAIRLFQYFIGITFLLFFTTRSHAQKNDSIKTIVKNDTILKSPDDLKSDTIKTIQLPKKYHSPKKAAIYSAIFPGLGQVYNKKYWKLPIIYAGAAGLVYSFQFNQSHYVKYRNAYKFRIDGDVSTTDNYIGKYNDEDLYTLQKYYHRYRDLTVLGFAALYALNIIDATVDAHLFTFDVSDDLSFNIRPTLINTVSMNRYTTGLSLNIKF